MTRVAALTRPLRRSLAERLGRLNAALSDLAARLRTAAATRIADNVAAIIRESVEEALAGPTVSYPPPRLAYHDPAGRWDDRDDGPRYFPSTRAGLDGPWPPHWADEEDERRLPPMRGTGLFARDPYEPNNDDEPDVDFEEADGNEPEATPVSVRSSPSTPRLHAALVLGLQASAWWLGRRRRTSLLMALAIGASAGTLALFASPLLDAGICILRSLLSLTG
jgi:hypothetical protein